jgi:hypothetical protein
MDLIRAWAQRVTKPMRFHHVAPRGLTQGTSADLPHRPWPLYPDHRTGFGASEQNNDGLNGLIRGLS